MNNGLISLILIVNCTGELREAPKILSRGVFDGDGTDTSKDLLLAITEAFAEFPENIRKCDASVAEEVRKILRKMIKIRWQTKPEIVVEVVRIKGG